MSEASSGHHTPTGPWQGTKTSLHHARHLISGARSMWASDLNREVVSLVDPRPGVTLLDLGAGIGPAVVEAARNVAPDGRVIALDPSGLMRALLRLRRAWNSSRRSIEVVDGVAESIPVKDASIDGAWAVNAAHHFDDLDAAVVELARVVKSGGRLVVVEEDLTQYFAGHRGMGHGEGPPRIDPDYLTALLARAGFEVTESAFRTIGGVKADVVSAVRRGDARPGS